MQVSVATREAESSLLLRWLDIQLVKKKKQRNLLQITAKHFSVLFIWKNELFISYLLRSLQFISQIQCKVVVWIHKNYCEHTNNRDRYGAFCSVTRRIPSKVGNRMYANTKYSWWIMRRILCRQDSQSCLYMLVQAKKFLFVVHQSLWFVPLRRGIRESDPRCLKKKVNKYFDMRRKWEQYFWISIPFSVKWFTKRVVTTTVNLKTEPPRLIDTIV